MSVCVVGSGGVPGPVYECLCCRLWRSTRTCVCGCVFQALEEYQDLCIECVL